MPPTSTPPPESEPDARQDWAPELLSAAIERAVVVARRDAGTRGAPPPPTSMRPVLGFTKKLPARAMRSVQRALDTDERFRSRVADGAEESALGRASWLFLHRPQGWVDELTALADAAQEEQRDTDAARGEVHARRRAEQLADTVDRLRDELSAARSSLAEADADLARERAARLEASSAVEELTSRVEDLEQARARAVRELKATEATSTARLEELRTVQATVAPLQDRLRRLEEQLEASPDTLPDTGATDESLAAQGAPRAGHDEGQAAPARERSPWDDRDPVVVAAAVERAARAAAELGAALAAAAAGLAPAPPTPEPWSAQPSTSPGEAATGLGSIGPSTSQPARPPRRVPVRLRSGVHDGTPEGLLQLLGVEGLVAIVDGYNVTMEGWPGLDQHQQRSSLVSALGGLQARVPAVVHVVFDGAADGRRPSVGAPLPVRVHFSAEDVEADDVILDMVAALPTDTPVVVVSSDRRVAEGARRLGANSVRSSVLLELLRR